MHHHHHGHEHNKISVNIIGGFLGAGKTTTVNHLLSQTDHRPPDVLIREYGRVSIDDQLIPGIEPDRIHVFAGLSLHDDPQIQLYDYLHRLAEEPEGHALERLLIETSGLDLPESMVQLFLLGHVAHLYHLGSYVALVDAEFGMLNLDEYPVAALQVAYADAIVINKTDRADSAAVDALERRLRSINRMAQVYRTQYGKVSPEEVLDIDLYEQLSAVNPVKDGDSMDNICTLVLSESRPMDKELVNKWIDSLFREYGLKILRSKGFLHFNNDDFRYEFQAVRTSFHSKADKIWPHEGERKSVIVLIGDRLLETLDLQESFSKCIAPVRDK